MEQPRDIVFISYSHQDTAWLDRILIFLKPYTRQGHLNIWADPYIKTGARWYRNIEVALERAKIGVLLVSPDFIASDFIMEEEYPRLLEAEASGQLTFFIIPISASTYHPTGLGDFQWAYPPDTPLDGLQKPNCNAALVEIVNELVKIAKSDSSLPSEENGHATAKQMSLKTLKTGTLDSIGQLHGVERQRPHFHKRPKEIGQIIQLLMGTESDSVGITSSPYKVGVQGMGGIGKTVLAIATANNEDVRRSFPDGIYWVSLGQQPDIVAIQAQLSTDLGFPTTAIDDSFSGLRALQQGFSEKNALLIIDDIWQVDHAKYFDVLGPKSRALYTTRDSEILTALGAKQVNIDVLSEKQALNLLAEWSEQPLDLLPDMSRQIAQSCGYIPLALSLAGALVRDGTSWEDVLQALQEGDLEFLDHPYGSVFKSLRLGVSALQPDEAARYLELAVFPEDITIPVNTVCRYWSFTGNLKDRQSQKLIRRLEHKGLLYLDKDLSTIRFHDLQRDFLRLNIDDIRTLNNQFLDAFRLLLPKRSAWHALPNDEPYLWSYLPYHLLAADETDELHQLLFDYLWLQNKLFNTSTNSLIADFRFSPGNKELSLLRDALRLSSHILMKDPVQLPAQLTGRLHQSLSENFRHLLEQVVRKAHRPWLHPRFPRLESPGRQLVRNLVGHSCHVDSVAVTPNGRQVVSASADGTIKIWDLATGETLQTLQGHLNGVTSVAVTPDGQHAVSGSCEQEFFPNGSSKSNNLGNTLKIWNLATGEALKTLRGHNGRVIGIVITPDGQRIISASSDSTLKVWDLATGEELLTLRGHNKGVSGVTLTPDGQHIISTSLDKTLKIWDLTTGKNLQTLRGQQVALYNVAVTQDGSRAISAADHNMLQVWDLTTGKVIQILQGHENRVIGVAVTPDGRRVISTSWDKTLKVWDLNTGDTLQTLHGHDDAVSDVAFTPDGQYAISASWDHTLRVWNLSPVGTNQFQHDHYRWVCSVAITPDGKRTISASADKTLKVWDLATGEALRILQGHTEAVFGVAVTPNGQHAISASADKTLKVWDLSTGKALRTLRGHDEDVRAVAVTPNGHCAVSASLDKTLIIWDLATGEALRTLQGHTEAVFGVAVTPDGQHAISASHDKTLKVWDLSTGKALRTLRGHDSYVHAVAVTPDGRNVISASYDRTLKIWALATGETLHTLLGHENLVNNVAVTPDGQRAISVSNDKSVKVWDLSTGELISKFEVDSSLQSCSVAPDGVTIVVWDRLCRMHILDFEN